MEHKIINIGDYLLIVDDHKDIEENMWTIKDGKITQVSYLGQDNGDAIIAHLPLNNSPILEGVILLPPLEDEVEIPMRNQTIDYSYGYRQGYNKAKEKYKYTEEDLMKAIDMAREYTPDVVGFTKYEIIQSIQKPKMHIGFKCEIETMNIDEIREQGKGFLNTNTNKLKTTTNSQGLTELVGQYIY
jgi:hypothetical protein